MFLRQLRQIVFSGTVKQNTLKIILRLKEIMMITQVPTEKKNIKGFHPVIPTSNSNSLFPMHLGEFQSVTSSHLELFF